MKDRYLFRGKRFDGACTWNNGWTQGNVVLAKNGYFITNILSAKFICDMSDDVLDKVDPATIGQCTGGKDKNGKLIFEGDVVKFAHLSPDVLDGMGVVVWSDDEMCWEYRDPHVEGCWFNGYGSDLYEIIGNIHDNPELITA